MFIVQHTKEKFVYASILDVYVPYCNIYVLCSRWIRVTCTFQGSISGLIAGRRAGAHTSGAASDWDTEPRQSDDEDGKPPGTANLRRGEGSDGVRLGSLRWFPGNFTAKHHHFQLLCFRLPEGIFSVIGLFFLRKCCSKMFWDAEGAHQPRARKRFAAARHWTRSADRALDANSRKSRAPQLCLLIQKPHQLCMHTYIHIVMYIYWLVV